MHQPIVGRIIKALAHVERGLQTGPEPIFVNHHARVPVQQAGSDAAFGVEGVINQLADELGIDRVDMRLTNAAKEGTQNVSGMKYGSTMIFSSDS